MSSLDMNHGVYSSLKVDRPIGNKREKKGWMDDSTNGDPDKHLVVLVSLVNANNDISKTIALREKKSNLLKMAKFYQSIKDKK